MTISEAVWERRSIRYGFTDTPVSRSIIEVVVESGLLAPSSKNAQPWRIHVVVDQSTRRELADEVREAKEAATYAPLDPATGQPREWRSTVVESARILAEAPVALFIENSGQFSSGRASVAAATTGVREGALVGYSFELIGLGAMIQNMWLTAHSHGLGGVFMGDVLVAEQALSSRLGIDGDLIGVLALGYSRGSPNPKQLAHGRVVWHRTEMS